MYIDSGAKCLENCFKCTLSGEDQTGQIQSIHSLTLLIHCFIFSPPEVTNASFPPSFSALESVSLRNRSNQRRISTDPTTSPASFCAYSLPFFLLLWMKCSKLCISLACALDPIPSLLLKDSESAIFPFLHHHSRPLCWIISICINCYHFVGSSSLHSSWILAVAS